jgi:hypothetical protein
MTYYGNAVIGALFITNRAQKPANAPFSAFFESTTSPTFDRAILTTTGIAAEQNLVFRG